MFRFADVSKSQLLTLSVTHSDHDLADQLSSESFDAVLIASDLKTRELQTAIETARPVTSFLLLSCSRESFRTELLPAAQNGIVEPTATASELLQILKNARAGKFSAPSWFFPKLSEVIRFSFIAYRAEFIPLARLTPMEEQIMNLISQHLENKEIAHALGISQPLVLKLIRSAYAKLSVTRRTEAAVLWSKLLP
ncbi:MAG TPA: LuxR C-terminal-related transcriptional regulator [Verrucomicrobiae bacterium]